MKKIAVLLIMLIFASCKKSEVKPDDPQWSSPSQPDKPVVTCKNNLRLFAGKYADDKGSVITIVFNKDNCPTDNSNEYTIQGLADAANLYLTTSMQYPAGKEFIMNSKEYESGIGDLRQSAVDKPFILTRDKDTGNISASGGGLPYAILFTKR